MKYHDKKLELLVSNLRIESDASAPTGSVNAQNADLQFAQAIGNAWGDGWQRGGTHATHEAAKNEALAAVSSSSYPLYAIIAQREPNALEQFFGRQPEFEVFYYDLNNQPHLTRDERAASAQAEFERTHRNYTFQGAYLSQGQPIRPTY